LALTFTCLALLCLIASGAYTIYLTFDTRGASPNGVDTYLSIYDFALFAIAYMLILIGNLEGSTLAYQGMLMYVFMTFSQRPLPSFKQGFWISKFSKRERRLDRLAFLCPFFYAAIIVTGIMTYIRTSQYLRNSYSNYIGVRTWCLLFDF
jgi:hypothetical protein